MFIYEFGIYVDGVLKDLYNYELFDLSEVNFERKIVIGKYLGRVVVVNKLSEYEMYIFLENVIKLLNVIRVIFIRLKRSLMDKEIF